MQYYLRHYFDPDFNHLNSTRGDKARDADADVYSLGYVQNVISGQLLAEVIPLSEAGPKPDKRFVLDSPTLPAGPNTRIDPAYPRYLLADKNGYVFYHEGMITVKHLLNVRQDVSFHTGNIFFVGDMAVHGSVRSGFTVQSAGKMRIMGMVEGGIVRSGQDLMLDGGARGGAGQHCLLDAGGQVLTPFVEKMQVRARGSMVIEKSCLYCTVYAGANLVVRGKMFGTTVNAYGSVYVGNQLGNKDFISTKVYMGYNPFSIRQLERLDALLSSLSQTIRHLKAVAGHLPPETNETTRKLAESREQRRRLIKRRESLWQDLTLDEKNMQHCRLMVPGTVYPGVEISVGRVFQLIDREYENVQFRLVDDEIVVESLPLPGAAGQKTATVSPKA